jgi:phage shock protein A
MLKLLRRWWKYSTAKLNGSFNERADPKVQLEQAIAEAQEQHQRLREQAANVIANQKQTEMRLSSRIDELDRVNAKATQYNTAAESFANKMIGLEAEIEDLKALHVQSSQAAEQAKAAVGQNSAALQKKLSDRQKLMGQLDQAKMQEQLNKAMSSLSETVGEDVPSFDEVRDKIESRYAKAKGMSELNESSVESRMLEVEQASRNTEAQSRLEQLRAEMGLGGTTLEQPS